MNVRAAKRIANALLHVEIGREKFLLLIGGEFGVNFGGGVREGAADANDRLEGLARIHQDGRERFVRLGQRIQFQGGTRTKPFLGPLGGNELGHVMHGLSRVGGEGDGAE